MIHIHTLGPNGTNCERAAREYMLRNGQLGEIQLHDTLEIALIECLKSTHNSVLLGCVVYPKLHEIVFENLGVLDMVDCFVMDTYDMVLASSKKSIAQIATVCSHPAPQHLVKEALGSSESVQLTLVNSNSQASRLCANGEFDACISTKEAAVADGLNVLKNFGAVPMGFSVHKKRAYS